MLSFQYPVWFLGFCILAGVAYAMGMYWRDRRFGDDSVRINRILGTLRFLAVTLLCILLMSPLLKSHITEVRKPVVVVAQDGSESIRAGMSKEDSAAYVTAMENLKQSLSDDYDVKTLTFGEKVREGADYGFKDKNTNISAVCDYTYDLYANQNLGAIILATDGIYNEGSSPLYSGAKLAVPMYAVALGDTTPKKDLYLKKVFNNRIAYLGDKFTLEADVAAYNCAGNSTRLMLQKVDGDQVRGLQEQAISIDKKDFFTTKTLTVEATEPGVQHYRLVLSTVGGEVSTINNAKDLFIEVLDARQKILLLANAPHPDIAALRTVITNNKNYDCELQYANTLQGGVAKYDFVILHQVPGTNGNADAVFAELKSKRIPHLFILGAQTNINQLNAVQNVLRLTGSINQTNNVEARLGKSFALFNLGETVAPNINMFPPLVSPFGEYVPQANTDVLLVQKIGAVETSYPLLLFGDEQGVRTGVLCGEGIYKWRVFDFMQHQNFDIADQIIGKTINYLSLKEDKRRFRVYAAKNVFSENEAINLDAELYNVSYELVNDPDAMLTVSNAQGKQFNFTFNKTSKAYTLNAGFLPVGNYKYEANTAYNGESFKVMGNFSVQPVQQELFQTVADHNLLRALAEKFGGKVFSPKDLEKLAETLKNENRLPAVRYESTTTRSLINLKWLFFLILALLSTEWFARRWYGGY